jgi:peptidoglycan/xylan/chitin deacetylase (PgdA/CDA1 family)
MKNLKLIHDITNIGMFLVFFTLFFCVFADNWADQKQNCSASVRGNYCYNGPQFDSVGQYKSCSVPGTIALTFDDGPSNYTNNILDILKKHNMKATFFIIGKKIHDNHDTIQRIADEGHQIGSHTYHHVYLDNVSVCPDPRKEMVDWEVAFVQEKFTGILSNGVIPNYMRAPHGVLDNYTYYIVRDVLGYLPIHWGFLTGDTNDNLDGIPLISASDVVPIYQSHLGGVSGRGVNGHLLDLITQQHDTTQATSDSFENLTIYLERLFGSQVGFVTVADCLGGNIQTFRQNPRLQNELNSTSSGMIIELSLITFILCLFFHFL